MKFFLKAAFENVPYWSTDFLSQSVAWAVDEGKSMQDCFPIVMYAIMVTLKCGMIAFALERWFTILHSHAPVESDATTENSRTQEQLVLEAVSYNLVAMGMICSQAWKAVVFTATKVLRESLGLPGEAIEALPYHAAIALVLTILAGAASRLLHGHTKVIKVE